MATTNVGETGGERVATQRGPAVCGKYQAVRPAVHSSMVARRGRSRIKCDMVRGGLQSFWGVPYLVSNMPLILTCWALLSKPRDSKQREGQGELLGSCLPLPGPVHEDPSRQP